MNNYTQYLDAVRNWKVPENWRRVQTIDAHTAGEPLRIFVDGIPEPQGQTVLQRRQDAMQRLESYRTGIMWEPRGHADMYGCLIVPPERADSDFGVLFMHNEGYSSMCGHGIIAVATVAVQTGWKTEFARAVQHAGIVPLAIDAPAGLVKVSVSLRDDVVDHVYFENVPSFVVALDQNVRVEGLGDVSFDLAYGGAFYAFVDADSLGLNLTTEEFAQLVELGRRIKQAVAAQFDVQHPEDSELSFLYGTIFVGSAHGDHHHSRHVCVFADGEVDRSPTGTGVSARAAILHKRRNLLTDEQITVESILGTCFDVRVAATTTVAGREAVIPGVSGKASITGRHEFVFDPADELGGGFILR